MKRMGDDGSGSAAGGGWFKIWQDGFYNGQFCTERLRANGGEMTVTIPSDLAGFVPSKQTITPRWRGILILVLGGTIS
jgi:hypothetical protein